MFQLKTITPQFQKTNSGSKTIWCGILF